MLAAAGKNVGLLNYVSHGNRGPTAEQTILKTHMHIRTSSMNNSRSGYVMTMKH